MTKKLDPAIIIPNVEKMQAWEDISRELFRAESLRLKSEKRAKQLSKDLSEKYGDNNAVLSEEIAEVNAIISDCEKIEAACYAQLAAIGNANLTDWQYNYAAGRDCQFSDNFNRTFRGTDKADFDETVTIMRRVLDNVVKRQNNVNVGNVSETNGDYLQIMTKGEYKQIQNSLSHFAHKLYLANKLKFKGDSIGYFMASVIRPSKKDGVALPKTDVTIRNAIIATINRLYIGAEDKATKKVNEK